LIEEGRELDEETRTKFYDVYFDPHLATLFGQIEREGLGPTHPTSVEFYNLYRQRAFELLTDKKPTTGFLNIVLTGFFFLFTCVSTILLTIILAHCN